MTGNPLVANVTDPAGQVAWFAQECANATANGVSLFVIGHVPPGVDERAPSE